MKHYVKFLIALSTSLILIGCPVKPKPDDGKTEDERKPEVFDKDLEAHLNQNEDIPYDVDENGTPIDKYSLIVSFKENVNTKDIERLKAKYGVINTKSCYCVKDAAELWEFDPADVNGTGGIEEKHKGIIGESEPESVEFNLKVPLFLGDRIGDYSEPNDQQVDQTAIYTKERPLVAVIDSGFDFDINYNSAGFVEPVKLAGGLDCNGSSLDFGIDMVNRDLMADDRVAHGTHVTGIIGQKATNVPYAVLPIKVFDREVGDLFDIYCGLEFADQMGADIINASFGWYKSDIGLMEKVIKGITDKGSVIVFSAGNRGSDNDVDKHYPSAYGLSYDSIVSVAGLNKGRSDLFTGSNFGKTEVDLAESGEEISSIVPSPPGQGNLANGTGTSMAAAGITGSLIQIMDTGLLPGQAYSKLIDPANINPVTNLAGKVRLEGESNF